MDLSLVVAVHLILAKGDGGYSGKEIKKLFAVAAQRYHEEMGITVKLKKMTVIGRDITRKWREGFTPKMMFFRRQKALQWMDSTNNLDSKLVRIFIVPAQRDGNQRIMFGNGQLCSYKDPTKEAMVFIAGDPVNGMGHSRTDQMITALEHELGHVLCSQHIELPEPTVMETDALSFVAPLLPDHLRFAEQSKNEIKNYLLSLKK